MKLKNILAYIIWVIVVAFIYIVLSEQMTYVSLMVGFGFGLASLVISLLFFKKTFIMRYYVKIVPLFWYFINLIIIIIISGIRSLILGLFSKTTSTLVTYKTEISNDMLITLLANSITLTPGTVTIDKADNVLKFMRLCKSQAPENNDDIKRLERMILNIEGGKK